MAKMDESTLKAITDAELRQSIAYCGGRLAEQRKKAMAYYYAQPEGDLSPPEIDGRSSVVVPVVRNKIEEMLPQLMLKFTGGDSVVDFEATKPGDEEKAQMCTDYLNYLFFKKNPGHTITLNWFKDAMKQKRGIVKVWWDNRSEETREEYEGLSDVELTQLLDDEELEPIEHNSYPDEDDAEAKQKAMEQLSQQLQQAQQAAQQGNPQAQQAVQGMTQQLQQMQAAPPQMLHDVTLKRTKTGGKITVENVPPEEFLISRDAKDIATARMVGHRLRRTRSDLKSMGYKNVDKITSDDQMGAFNAERIERMRFDDEYAAIDQVDGLDKSQEALWITECYMRVDWDGDGISELRKIVRAGDQILENEVVDVVPFASICPVPIPHKFFGLSIADLAMEGQKTETNILRARLDNMYLEVNGRYFAVEGQVNLDDLMTSRPGGLVRVKSPGAVGRLDQGRGDAGATMGMLEYMQTFIEDSTGWSRASQGTSATGLNQTATAANIVTNKSDMRLDLVARNFAEGFTDLFKLMLKLVCQHQNKNTEVRMRGNWVDIDPREWRNLFDVSINVGLGVGNKDQQVQHVMALLAQQEKAFGLGVCNPTNVYEASSELAKLLGFKRGERFFVDPSTQPPKPPQPNPDIEKAHVQAQAQQQIEAAKLQSSQQIAQAEAQFRAQVEQVKAQAQAEVDRNRQSAEAQQHQLKLEQEAHLAQFKMQLDDQRHQRDVDFQRWKAELDSATKIEVAKLAATGAPDTASQAAEAEIGREIQ